MKTLKFLVPIIFCIACQVKTEEPVEVKEDELLIAYNVLVNEDTDDYDVFAMDLSGNNKRNLLKNPDVAWTYLAGTNKIYFISDRDTCSRCVFLHKLDITSGEVMKVYDVQLRDSWMSSNEAESRIIVKPHPSIDSAFHIIDTLGNLVQRIDTGLPFSSDPQFSPDGSQIAFRGGEASSKREPEFNESLYLINLDGSGLVKLTNYPKEDTTAEWFSYKAGPPKWHPTENFISYQSFQKGKYSLFAVNPQTKENWKLTDNPQNEGWHDWSPDGKFLAIEIFDQEQTQFHIGLMNWDDGELAVLTDTSYRFQQAPVFISIK